MISKKTNVLVCGTRFGEYYIKALRRDYERFNIVGILSRGSEYSEHIAEKYGLKTYKEVKKLPKDIDLACVIIRSEGVGGEGTKLSKELLSRNINVIQEQPIHQKYLLECYKQAKQRGLLFMVSNFYIHLPNIETFIKKSIEMAKDSKMKYLSMMLSTQISFTGWHILLLSGIWGEVHSLQVLKKGHGPFDIISGYIGKIPITIELNNMVNSQDPNVDMEIMHRFCTFYSVGNLMLEDTFGPVAWRTKTFIESELTSKHSYEVNPYLSLYDYGSSNIKEIFETSWIEAIKKEILLACRYIEMGGCQASRVQGELIATKNWEKMIRSAGFAQINTTSGSKQ